MKTILITGVVVFAIVGSRVSAEQGAATSAAADQDIQLLRKDLRSAQKQIVAANVSLTEGEALKFWPVYDQYRAEAVKINDAKLSLIKEYATNYENLSDAQAESLISKWSAADDSAVQLRMKYIPIFEKVISGKKAARFFQIDRRLGVLLDLQLASEIPLVEP
jgi:hypothetical protein